MTPKEFKAASLALSAEIGPRAKVWAVICYHNALPLEASVHTNWPVGDAVFTEYAENFADLFTAVKLKWAEYKETHRAKTIRKMALEILRITAEHGHCTDAALRGIFGFSDNDVTAYGALACEDANKIAANGPFSIVANGGANASGLENVERNEGTPLQ